MSSSQREGRNAQGQNQEEVVVEGEVARITFENNETGFRVVKLDQEVAKSPGTLFDKKGEQGNQDLRVTLVGVMPPITPGARVRVRAHRIHDARHGEQLKVITVTELSPTTLIGIERYLASGAVQGVGPTYAKRIVEAFGLETLRVLDDEPDRLRAVEGVGKKRAETILESWRSHRAIRDVMVFLQTHGASPGLSMRIWKRYGTDAIRKIKEDPYRLSLDVWGIGFRTADKIAQSLGVDIRSEMRTCAGIMQILVDNSEQGHVYATESILHDRARVLLEREDLELVECTRSVERLKAENLVFFELVSLDDDSGSSTKIVYRSDLYAAEMRVAETLVSLVRRKLAPIADAERALNHFEQSMRVQLASEQKKAIEIALFSPVSVITGGPGVGKTTIVRAVLNALRHANHVVRLAAPTGRAAKRLSEATSAEAATLHRLLEFDPRLSAFKRDAQNPLEGHALIIDEVSMVDLAMMDALLQAVAQGMRLVLVGDVDQLASVGPGAILRDVLASGEVPYVRLREIFRQGKTSNIVINAHRINEGEMPLGDQDASAGSDFFFIERKDPDKAAETIVELVSSRIPNRFGFDPLKDIQVLTPMHRGPVGSLALNARLQEVLNPGPRTEPVPALAMGRAVYRPGDKVMQLKNDYDHGVWNGDVGSVLRVEEDGAKVVVRFDETREITYERGDLDQITLSYACSIHKSQGSEYPCVVIPMLTSHFVMLSRNLLYTAVTRARRLVVLVADTKAISMALSRMTGDERLTRLATRIREQANRP
jgi:exodeoxyribonuclease V alpha subunit